MNRRGFLQASMAAPLAAGFHALASGVVPRLIAQDRGSVSIRNPNGSVDWSWANGFNAHDMHLLPGGNLLVPTARNMIVELSPEKEVVWKWESKPLSSDIDKVEIHAFERFDNGWTMISETGNRRIIEVDRNGAVQHEIQLVVDKPHSHRDTRLVRRTPQDTYLVTHENDGTVREYTRDGQVIWEYKLQMTGPATPTHRGHGDNVYSAYRLPNGNTLIGGGNNNRVLEVNPKGDITWSLDQNELPGYKLYWVTQLQALPNNNIVVTNTHAEQEAPQIFEITRQKEIVWSLLDWNTFGNDLCVNILLDTRGPIIR